MSDEEQPILTSQVLVEAGATPRSDKMAETVRCQNMQLSSAFNCALALCRKLEDEQARLRLLLHDQEMELDANSDLIEELRAQLTSREVIAATRSAKAKTNAKREVKAQA